MTRFKPSMVEIKPDGQLVTPAVWDLHLHHVVWLPPGGGPLAAGEEKTISMLPQGFGIKLDATADWGLLHMLHNLTAQPNRSVYLTWQIDWVPETTPPRTDISPDPRQFMDIANGGAYPVFDAERRFDTDGDGKFVFPDDVSTDPADAELRGARQDQRDAQVDCSLDLHRRSHAAQRRRPPASRRALRRPERLRATAPTPATSTATIPPRSDPSSAPTRTTTSPRAR